MNINKNQSKAGSWIKSFRANGGLDIPFFMLVVTLLTIGLVMMFSASYAYAYYNQRGDSLHYIKRQAVFAVIGLVIMLFISKIDYKKIRKFTFLITGITFVFLVVVLFLPATDGVKRWVPLGLFQFQPSEVAKFALVLLLAHFISLHPERMTDKKYVGFLVIIIGVFTGMILLEKHLSATILIVLIGFCMLIAGGVGGKKGWVIAAILVVMAVVVIALIFIIYKYPNIVPHAKARLDAWLDKSYDPMGDRWQTNQSLYAIGSGGFLGVGLGQSMQKYLYVSEPQNDFIFAIVCEELGFVGAVAIILLFVLLVWRGFTIAMRAKDRYGTFLALGLVLQVGIQTVLNIAVVTDTIPNTGISLPFFSYGGTSLVMLLAQMGVVLSVSRSANLEKN